VRTRLACLLSALLAAGAAAQPGPGDKEKERFLLEAEIVKTEDAPGGVTGSLRATLRLGGVTHEANIQTIDEFVGQKRVGHTTEIDFRDSYRNNVAAYRLDRMLGLGMIPATVVRKHDGRQAAFTWWVDDMLMLEKERFTKKLPAPDTEAWNRQVWVVRLFDQLIFNFDRKAGNLVIDRGWRVWMIDHRRAFKLARHLGNPRLLGDSCERDLLAALRTLRAPALKAEMKDLLSDGQVEGLLARRDAIVAYYDRMIADRGEAAVLFDLPPRVGGLP
jgi:hypothetical protein